DAPGALHVGLHRHLHGRTVEVAAVTVTVPAERIGVRLGPRHAGAARPPGPHALALPLLLQLLGKPLGALAHGVEGASLAVDRAVRIAVAELAFGVAHVAAVLAGLTALILSEALLLELFHQLLEAVAQRLLVLLELAEGVRVALLAL